MSETGINAMPKSKETEIAVLQNQMKVAQADITEIKADLKHLIDTVDNNFVTKGEFAEYKKSQIWQKVLIALGFTLIGALVTYFFSTVGK